MRLNWIDLTVLAVYFAFVLGVGAVLKRRMKTSSDFLLSGRAIPLWITSLAFISANLGAQEVLGMAASGAKYGMMTAHLYWLGAIPAMLFLGIFMMPFYYGSKARSVPEYLSLRFDEKTRAFNAASFAAMTVFSSGVSLYALALLFETLFGWNFSLSLWVSALIVMGYTWLGGLTSAVYNEVLQFFLIVLGTIPIVVLGMKDVGGFAGLKQILPAPHLSTWSGLGSAQTNPMGIEVFGLVFGLGFVLSFGYWCTDFLVVQRAMVARNETEARTTPLMAALPKMLLPFVVIVPGLLAVALTKDGSDLGSYALPLKADGRPNFDMALPSLLLHYLPHGLLGVGITALVASFMSGMAGNVTAFNTVFTYDLYQAYIKKKASDQHYLQVGKLTTVVGIMLSIATAYVARSFNNIMDLLQLVFGFVNAPLFATFMLGMFWKRTTGHGAFWGLVSGTTAAALTHGLTVAEGKGGWLFGVFEFRSAMGQAFWIAIFSWTTCFLVTLIISLFTKPKSKGELEGLVYGLTARTRVGFSNQADRKLLWFAGAILLGMVILNGVFL